VRYFLNGIWISVLAVYIAGCCSLSEKDKYQQKKLTLPQIRLFCEPTILPDSKRVTVIRLYGVDVLQDGSERVLWSRTVGITDNRAQDAPIVFSYGVHYINESGTFYLIEDFTDSAVRVWKLNANTGKCKDYSIISVTSADKYKDINRRLGIDASANWHNLPIVPRPFEQPKKETSLVLRTVSDERRKVSEFPEKVIKIPSIEDVQIRIFLDINSNLDSNEKYILRAYGMRVMPDGSEKAVWRVTLDSLASGERCHLTRLLIPDAETVYIGYGEKVFELDRNTGEIHAVFAIQASHSNKAFMEFLKKYRWYYVVPILRLL